jgi:pyruvate-ferredoxin/flavodoxin oxidoreductase
VQAGHWPLFRFNPTLAEHGKNPLVLDSRAPSVPLEQYIYNETRYTSLKQSQPEIAAELLESAKSEVEHRWKMYEYLSHMPANGEAKQPPEPKQPASPPKPGNGDGRVH